MGIITAVFLLFYVVTLISLSFAKSKEVREVATQSFLYSIIVPARNEAQHLPQLLKSLTLLKGAFEVILVDDDSNDDTLELMNRFSQSTTLNVLILSLQRFDRSPKKAAIELAVQQAKGDIILTTDADCEVPHDWLLQLDKYYSDSSVQLVTGGVYFEGVGSILSKIQSLEQSALLFISSKLMHLHFPFTCNGANLSYRKEVFEAVEGFKGIDHIASGDDELLMKKIACKYPMGIRFQSNSWVKTWPQKTLSELMQQKIRWASKWKIGSVRDKTIGFYIMLMYVFILVSLLFDYSSKVFWFGLIAKFFVDSWVTSFYWRSKKEQGYPFFYNLILFLIYPFYTVIIGSLSIFKKYKWKGRVFS